MADWKDIVWSFVPYVKQPADVWRDIPCRIYSNTNQIPQVYVGEC